MKKLVLLLVSLLPSMLLAQSKSYETNFPLTENPISESSGWINGGVTGGSTLWGNVQTNGFAYGVSLPTTYGDPTAVLAGTWNTNQWAKGVVYVASGNQPSVCCHEVELRLRTSITSNSINGYELNCSVVTGSPYIQLVRWNGANGSFLQLDQLTPSGPCVNGDVLMMTVTGAAGATVVHAWRNGTALTFTNCNCTNPTDTSGITTGSPGVGFYDNQDSNWQFFGLSHFEAGDASGGISFAASCSGANINSSVSAVAVDNAVVVVPGGSCTYPTTSTTNITHTMTLLGQSDTIGACSPGGSCTTRDLTSLTVTAGALNMPISSGKTFRVSGFSFITTGSAAYGDMNFNGSTSTASSLRLDHNHITDNVSGGHTFHVDSDIGVVDHNYFDGTADNLFNFQVNKKGASGWGNESWNQADGFGTNNFIFLEDNVFAGKPSGTAGDNTGTWAYDCYYAGRVVMRYNILGIGGSNKEKGIQLHGTGSGEPSGGGIRGCRAEEIYGNTFTYSGLSNDGFSTANYMEGGIGLAWNNTVTKYCSFISSQYVRTNPPNPSYTQRNPPNGWGICWASPVGGVNGPSAWDGNAGSNGYPCLDQTGRGQCDLLPAVSPTNNWTTTAAWPNQKISPWYTWNNTVNSNAPYCGTSEWSGDPETSQNRDFFSSIGANCPAGGSCLTGIGTGTLLPTSGTLNTATDSGATAVGRPGTAFWNTSTQTLYRYTTSGWIAYYTPYTYPHPLDTTFVPGSGGGGGSPTASLSPNSLAFSAQQVNSSSPTQTVVLSNTGTATMNITSIVISGDFSNSTTCGSTLANGSSCNIVVTFTPTIGGNRTGSVTVTDDASGSPQVVPLTGQGFGTVTGIGSITIQGNVTIKP